MSSPADFSMVGARFSRIFIDEQAFVGAQGTSFNMEISVQAARVSEHKFDDRSVIEMGVQARAVGVDDDGNPAQLDEVFIMECVAGFVGSSPDLDGDLDRFAQSSPFFGRAIYWMLRERMQSVVSVTLLRHANDLPWDLDESVAKKLRGDDSKPKKVARKKKAPH
ncbi:hypothetical protein [Stenotrophomonas sp. Ps181]|uniref:hypothetical protein n=1 Tax=Stenotrophomonas sp. Ps181 TaxID=2859892 RepID=UPI0021E16C83|nr:hypothetical protein [Stenotrophomonas sp. Ps181]MCV0219786.1 hypothetical protein [Stenotrophomonas sp. Ps181]